ncbi:hypothetical protein [Yersinia phage fHe-Yen9-04]|uniref:Uncharacterized protein n=1 Tax=Yersinia phage fHe-Yen9-04 TaxID=2052742 RepID=A0A2C9D0C8_9CAUD|nr:hypothetical protein FDJ41_gp418 [Yersinia phage fHe-Yen9-04]SOK58762.1 hypothetical protein [Yersinia phage fHe-Yen9-04]VUE36531.1 hypothetical protein [Yersinia phage fHe-Yen9-04]
MKFIGIIFLGLVCYILYVQDSDASSPSYHNAYCSGYASKMASVYRLQYYHKMQKYFDNLIDTTGKPEFMSEYYQSGEESVKLNVAVSQNLNSICEKQFKRK